MADETEKDNARTAIMDALSGADGVLTTAEIHAEIDYWFEAREDN